MKIAIDGPSASGKGSISKILAEKLNAKYLNTGKIYRIIALVASKMQGDLQENAIEASLNVEKYFDQYSQNSQLFTEENAKRASQIAQNPKLRENLIKFQQDFAKNNKNVILEGRDIGTVIMPDADFKFFLDASPEERARRRVAQLLEAGKEANLASILEDIKKRDEADINRQTASLKMAEDAFYIDTTKKTKEEVVAEILKQIKLT